MTSFLSRGISEYCKCGHHITDHEEDYTLPMNTSIGPVPICAHYYQCLSMVSEPEKCKCSLCLTKCKCNKFTPYRELNSDSHELEVKHYVLDDIIHD
jgi:hypothetical protein